MRATRLIGALAMTLATILVAAGCSKKQPDQASQPASPPAVSEPATAPAADATVAAAEPAAGNETGAQVFKTYCSTCHGATGKGDGATAAALNPKPANFAAGAFKYDANGNGATGDIDDIKSIVHDGAAKHGGSPLMAPWPMLTPEQLQAVAEYVRALHGT